MTTKISETKDLVISLLRGSSTAIPVSDLWRGLQNHGVEIGYNELEDWLFDQLDFIEISTQGQVSLKPGIDASHIRRSSIVPDRFEQIGDIDATTRLHRLITYYRDCIQESGKSIYAYREQQNISFVTLDQELYSIGKSFASVRTVNSGNFVKNVSGANRPAYYGYPLLLQWIETGDGEFADYKIIPVFIARLDIQEEPERCIFHLATKAPRLNPLVVEQSNWKDRSYVRSKLDADPEFYSSFSERVRMVESIFQNIPVIEELEPGSILRASDLTILNPRCSGFYNRCGIFLGGANPYVKGLIKDLEGLLDKSSGHFDQTALPAIICSSTENAECAKKYSETIRVFNPGSDGEILNASQEAAVKNAFSNRLSVVTGPPGTGKSQVVTAIATSAVLQDKTVLFASRNNKALQVVEERFKRICPNQHALIRVGGNYDKECCELLERMGNLPPQDDAVPFHRLMESIELHLADLDALDKIIDTTAIALGEASLSEERFSFLKKKFLPGVTDAYEMVKAFDAKTLLRTALILEKIIKRVATWPAFLANVTIRCYRRSGKKDLESLQLALEAVNIQLNLKWPGNRDELQKTLKHILSIVDLVTSAQKMAVTAGKIGDAAQLESVFEKIVEHKQSIAKKIPGLLLSKVRENSAGRALPETTEDALLQYRDIMPQLRGTRLNEEQRNARLSSLGGVFPDLLKRLPAWAVTNLSASSRIPLEPGVFDLVIIDEASQCDIPSCIPLLYRAKQAVIIGDPLQLPQITQISQVVEDQFLRQNCLDGSEYNHLRYSEKSIYDAARRGTPRAGYQFLSNHYRCHPDIIQFANSSHWYEDRLDVFTDVDRLKRPGFWKKGVEWIQVNSRIIMKSPKGFYLPEEVDKATDIVHDLLETRKYEGTVGVVCPLRGIVDRIRDRVSKSVHARLLQTAEFEAQTAHGFQGDERDVIVYVMAVHPDMPRGPKWFIAENRNLFNVALSRARAAFVVVGDMEAVRNFSFENRPVDYLKDFVCYVEALGKEKPIEHGEPIFSPEQLWEERFYCKALKPAKLPVFSQYPLGPYKLDFALLRKNRQQKLDLEIDGETYHKDASGHRLRKDIDRDIFVKAQDGRSWDVMRFWVYELREDMESCLKKVTHWMNSAP